MCDLILVIYLRSYSTSDGVRNLLCSLVVNVPWDECNQQCLRPCRENVYDIFVSSPASWPQKSYYNAFYDKYIKDTHFADKFHKYARETVSI